MRAAPSFLASSDSTPSNGLDAVEQPGATPLVVEYWRLIVRERFKLLAALLLGAAIAFVVSTRIKPVYEASSSLMFERGKGPVSVQGAGGGVSELSAEDGLSEFLKTSDVALRVIRKLNLASREEFVGTDDGGQESGGEGESQALSREQRALEHFQDNLKITRIHQNPLVKISFQSEDPKLAAAIVNEVPAAFIHADMDARHAASRDADRWLNERLIELKAGLDRSEKALAQYRSDHGIVARDGDEASEQHIAALTQRLIDARARLAAAEDAHEQATSEDMTQVMASPRIAGNPAVARAREARSVAAARVAELRSQLGTAHPQYRRSLSELRQAQDDLREQVEAARREVAGELAAAQANERQVVSALNVTREAMKNLGGKEIELRQLEQEVNSSRQLYQTFLGRMKEVSAASDLHQPAARMIDRAQVPNLPVKPRKTLMTLMGALLGLVAGFFGVVLRDQLDDTLRRSDDVEERLGRPLFGSIPRLGRWHAGKASMVQQLKPDSLFAESIRTLGTNVLLSGLGRGSCVITICSTVDREGKTVVATNLAIALASSRRVLLIDGDMRRPAVTTALGLHADRPGLAEVLSGVADVDSCLTSVPDSSLMVLGAGRAAGNALDLLMSKKLNQMLVRLQSRFDVIIVDCPPVQLVSDALVLGRASSGMVYVVRSNSTSVRSVRRALRRLDKAGVEVLGVVLNGHDFEKADRFYGEESGYGQLHYSDAYGKRGRELPSAARAAGARQDDVVDNTLDEGVHTVAVDNDPGSTGATRFMFRSEDPPEWPDTLPPDGYGRSGNTRFLFADTQQLEEELADAAFPAPAAAPSPLAAPLPADVLPQPADAPPSRNAGTPPAETGLVLHDELLAEVMNQSRMDSGWFASKAVQARSGAAGAGGQGIDDAAPAPDAAAAEDGVNGGDAEAVSDDGKALPSPYGDIPPYGADLRPEHLRPRPARIRSIALEKAVSARWSKRG